VGYHTDQECLIFGRQHLATYGDPPPQEVMFMSVGAADGRKPGHASQSDHYLTHWPLTPLASAYRQPGVMIAKARQTVPGERKYSFGSESKTLKQSPTAVYP
jgi:hypothetical protein